MEAPTARKRGFDIASLVDHHDDHSSKRKKVTLSSPPPMIQNESPAITLKDVPFFPPGLRLEGLAAQLAEAHANSSHTIESSTGQVSAFKKVDKTSASSSSSSSTASAAAAAAALPIVLSSMYIPSRQATVQTGHPSLFSIPPTSVTTRAHDQVLSSPSTSNGNHNAISNNNNNNNHLINNNNSNSHNNNNSSHNNNNNSNSLAKNLIPPSLLPFLPPSLAALSFPHTNWCAKCNASFRMTSDLVYHMRSHHKPFSSSDPVKRKREEKLRCNICGESFRERHHLTRHLTSHQ